MHPNITLHFKYVYYARLAPNKENQIIVWMEDGFPKSFISLEVTANRRVLSREEPVVFRDSDPEGLCMSKWVISDPWTKTALSSFSGETSRGRDRNREERQREQTERGERT